MLYSREYLDNPALLNDPNFAIPGSRPSRPASRPLSVTRPDLRHFAELDR